MRNVSLPGLIFLCLLQLLVSFGNAAIPLLKGEGVQTVHDVSQADWLVALLGAIVAVSVTAAAKIQNPGGKKNPNVLD